MTRPSSTRSRRARRPLLAVGLAALLAVGAAAGATAAFSARTQTVADELTRKLMASARATGAVDVQQTGYARGLTRSTQTMTVTFKSGTARAGQADQPLRVLVTNHIQHGPFPGLSGVGQAVIDTDLRFEDPRLQAQLDRAFAGKTPRLHTVVGLAGNTDTRVDIPGGTLRENGDTVTWQPLGGHITVGGSETRTDLSWPGLTVLSADGNGRLRGLTLDGHSRRSGKDDVLGVGQSTLKIAELSFGAGGQQGSVRGIAVSAESREAGAGFSDARLGYDVAEVSVAGQSLKNLQLHLAARHLARAPLGRLAQWVNEVQADDAGRAAASTPTAAQRRELSELLLAVLRGGPVLSVERLQVGQAGQEVVLSGQVTVPDAARLSAADLETYADDPQQLAGRLDLEATVSGTESAVRTLLAGVGGPLSGLEDNLGSLVDAGYLRRDGERLSMTLKYVRGRGTLNGQALGDF